MYKTVSDLLTSFPVLLCYRKYYSTAVKGVKRTPNIRCYFKRNKIKWLVTPQR